MQLIRIRFPVCGIWDLPIVAHEFGHFAAARITVSEGGADRVLPFARFVDEYLDENRNLGNEWRDYLSEYFADCFATFVLGPSYACTSLLLRFDIGTAYAEADMLHPSYAKRAHAILCLLRRMDAEADSAGDFTGAVGRTRPAMAGGAEIGLAENQPRGGRS